MGILKQRKNKKFDYTPRFYKGEGNPYEVKHKFDEFRQTAEYTSGLKNKFRKAVEDYKHNANRSANRRILIIVGILVLLFLLVIDFDLSIFFKSN